MSGLNNEHIKYFIEYDIDILASSVSKLEAIGQVAGLMKKKARVHLEIDTGIERVGVHYYNSESLFTKVLYCKNSEIVGVSSHFAKQDSSDLSFTKLQLERFLESVAFFEKHSLPLPLRHIAASGATLQLPESHLDMVRPGVALYGAVGGEHLKGLLTLKPLMGLSLRVVSFKV